MQTYVGHLYLFVRPMLVVADICLSFCLFDRLMFANANIRLHIANSSVRLQTYVGSWGRNDSHMLATANIGHEFWTYVCFCRLIVEINYYSHKNWLDIYKKPQQSKDQKHTTKGWEIRKLSLKCGGGEIQKRRRAAREERPPILTPKTKCCHKT